MSNEGPSWYRNAKAHERLIKTASMNLVVTDYQYDRENETLLDLSSLIMSELYDHVKQMISVDIAEGWVSSRGYHETVTPDGDSVFDREGIMNIYLDGLPPDVISDVVNAFIYFAGEFGAEAKLVSIDTWGQADDRWKRPGNITNETPRVARIKTKMGKPKKSDDPPRLNISNQTAHDIFNGMLNYPEEIVIAGGSMPVWEVIVRANMKLSSDMFIKEWTRETTEGISPSGAKWYDMGRDLEFYKRILKKIVEIAEWASNHDYRTISLTW